MKKFFKTITVAASMLLVACTTRQDINLAGNHNDMFDCEIRWADGNNDVEVHTGIACTTTATLYGTNKIIQFHLYDDGTDIEYSIDGGEYTTEDLFVKMDNNKPVSVSYRSLAGNGGFPKIIASIPDSRISAAKNIVVHGNSSLEFTISIPEGEDMSQKATVGYSTYSSITGVFGGPYIDLGWEATENGEPNMFIKGTYYPTDDPQGREFVIEACIEMIISESNGARIVNYYGINGYGTAITLDTKPWSNVNLSDLHAEFDTGNPVWDEYLNNSVVIDKVTNGSTTYYTAGPWYRDVSFPISGEYTYLSLLFRFN